jgi:hypothetical protein
MDHQRATPVASTAAAAAETVVTERSIPELVAEVYEEAPPVERSHLLEQLMRPLGVLSLFGIAGGVFASLRLRSGWNDVRIEDIQNIHASQVTALVDHAQQVSVETVDGLAQMLSASPVLSGSAAAALLIILLLKRARSRETGSAGPAFNNPTEPRRG